MKFRKGQVMAVSTVLILLLAVSGASFYYTQVAPDQVEEKESTHMDEVESSITSQRNQLQGLYTSAPESWDNDTYLVQNGLKAFYPMDTGIGSTVKDTSGNNNDGILRYGATWSFPGLREHGTRYDGSGDETYVSGSGSLNFRNGRYLTTSAWVKKKDQSTGQNDAIISQPGGAFQLRFENWENKKVEFIVHDKGYWDPYEYCYDTRRCNTWTVKNCWNRQTGNKRICNSRGKKKGKYCYYRTTYKRVCDSQTRRNCYTTTVCETRYNWVSGGWRGDTTSFNAELPSYNEWHHVTGVLRNNKLEIWINGEKKAETSFSGRIRDRDWSSSDVYLGNNPDSLHGELDNARIYDRALSQNEIRKIASRNDPSATISESVDLSADTSILSGSDNRGSVQTSPDGLPRVKLLYNLNSCGDTNNAEYVDVNLGNTVFDFQNSRYPDQRYIREAGSVIREQGESSSIIEEPFVTFTNDPIPNIELQLIDLQTGEDISGDTSTTVSSSLQRYFQEQRSFSQRIAIEIESDNSDAWKQYLDNEVQSRGIGQVQKNGNKVRACVDQADVNIKYGGFNLQAD